MRNARTESAGDSPAPAEVFERGTRQGEGLFETLRVEQRQPLLWDLHMERLVVSAAELGFPAPPAPQALRHALAEVLEAQGLTDAVARITVPRGAPTARPGRAARRAAAGTRVEAEPLEQRLWEGTRRGAARAVVAQRPFEPGPLGRHKTTNRLAYRVARDEARARGADEALLVSPAGEVLEGAVSNLLIVRGDRIITPPLDQGILPGIMRRMVLERCAALGIAVEARPLPLAELFEADEALLTNAVQQVVPLATIEDADLPGRALGLRLAEACRAAIHGRATGLAASRRHA